MGEKITPPLRYGRSELSADLVIVGGGLGGCAAALTALRRGLHVVMTEETRWIGGQLTQQAFPPDENAWIESIGGTRSYIALRQAIREHYRQHTPLTPCGKRSWRPTWRRVRCSCCFAIAPWRLT